MEWDVENNGEVKLADEEWQQVQEGLEDCKKGNVISINKFLKKR